MFSWLVVSQDLSAIQPVSDRIGRELYRTTIAQTVEKLRVSVDAVWLGVAQVTINDLIGSWHRYLMVCVAAHKAT